MDLRQTAFYGLVLLWAAVLTVGGATTATLQALGPPTVIAAEPIPVVTASLVPVRTAPPPPLPVALPVPPVPPRPTAPHPRVIAQTRPPLREPENYYEQETPAAYAAGWENMRVSRPQYNMGYYSYYYPRY